MVNTSLLLLVKNNLQDLAAILLGAETLANDLDWVDQVGEDSVVNSSEGSGTWSLLGLGSAGAVASLWAWENAAGSEDEDVAVRELLLELTGETEECISMNRMVRIIFESMTYRCCTRWKPWRDGTGTKMTIAFLPWPTSIYNFDQSQHAISNISASAPLHD